MGRKESFSIKIYKRCKIAFKMKYSTREKKGSMEIEMKIFMVFHLFLLSISHFSFIFH